MSFLTTDIDAYKAAVEQWKLDNHADLKNELQILNVKHSAASPNKTALKNAIKSRVFTKFDLPSKVGVKMPKSAIFLHKGVGRGRPASSPKGAKEWFNPVVERNLDKLGDIAADHQGTLIINAIKIK